MVVEDAIDVFNLIRDNSDDQQEFIDNILSILDSDLKSSKFGQELDTYFKRYCDEHDYCYNCGRKLQYSEHEEPREYQGFDCSETITERYCPNCGEI